MNMRVMAIGIHPDDVEISCGGTVAVCAARGEATALIHQNAIQPGTEPIAFLIPIERFVRAQEGGLKRVLRVIAVAQHADCETCTAIVIPVYQRSVSVNVATKHTLNIGGIVAHVLGYNPPPRGWRHIRL